MSEEIRGALNVRGFILKNRDRFGSAEFPVEKVRRLAGYYHAEERWYLFTPEGFAEACGGIPEKIVAKALRSQRLLHTNNSSHLKSRLSIPGLAERLEVYAVRQAILESDSLPLSKG